MFQKRATCSPSTVLDTKKMEEIPCFRCSQDDSVVLLSWWGSGLSQVTCIELLKQNGAPHPRSINQSINQISIGPISLAKPDSVAWQPNQCPTAKSKKQFRYINRPSGMPVSMGERLDDRSKFKQLSSCVGRANLAWSWISREGGANDCDFIYASCCDKATTIYSQWSTAAFPSLAASIIRNTL